MCRELGKKTSERPKVIAYSANKGGVGKTRYALLSANCLGACGKKVLFIDMDFNNSSTFYYLVELSSEAEKDIIGKNIADAMMKEENRLDDYSILTGHKGVSLISSSRGLSDLRAVNEKRLLRMMPTLNGLYDFVIIDCGPNYDNIVLNAINAADLIITPVLKDMDSFNSAAFLQKKISVETDKGNCWFLSINGFDRQYEDARGGKQRDSVKLFQDYFSGHMTPSNTWFPWTADMNEIKDKHRMLSRVPAKGAVNNPGLYNCVIALVSSLVDEEDITWAEVF